MEQCQQEGEGNRSVRGHQRSCGDVVPIDTGTNNGEKNNPAANSASETFTIYYQLFSKLQKVAGSKKSFRRLLKHFMALISSALLFISRK